ncbi:hypothetical protein M1B72_04105 [Geomonas paludis]|uniref:4-vinyl reductase 4VR domain-containing protein n=1 Tax=Geomonas paludis TaxID=2740185 RepID=A0A6V8MZI7_9BACT|nr:hypothetical protein [Geomonas paludis]UPU36901.1 hypothetical protein M1B72_04105 [Geomonas paludis]GFO65572.1 hypothetical protein GMPD_34910 [Geomonas paludis]
MNNCERSYNVELSADDYQKAYVEVAFLLDAFASTIDNIMGGNTAPVGRIAGRDTAEKLPLELSGASLEEVVGALSRQMQAGFQFSLTGEQLTFERCILREMCGLRRIELGGALCRLFHAYFDGIANGLLCRPVKSTLVSVGDQCSFQTAVQ